MTLYFIRHGKAEDHHGGDDAARRLTKGGEAKLRDAAVLWRRVNLRPDLVLTSPLIRAVQTAQILVDDLGLSEPPVEDDRLGPGASWSRMAQAMADHGSPRRIAIVGHQPDLGEVVTLLTGAAARLRPGGVACIEFPGAPEPGAGELAWLLDPDLYTD